MHHFQVGQKVRCKSRTSMAAQFHKFQAGDEFTVTFISLNARGTILSLRRNEPKKVESSLTFNLVPAADFEPIDEQSNLPS